LNEGSNKVCFTDNDHTAVVVITGGKKFLFQPVTIFQPIQVV